MSNRARSYNTEGVVLRRRNLGEADSIFTVFSPTEGKFDAIAKGVRKPKSHMRGHLEPLTRSKMHIAQGRNLDVFTQAETIAGYRAVRDDLDRLTLALYCSELVERFTVDRSPQPQLYDLLNELLEGLDTNGPLTIGRSFELQILAMSGYEMQLANCAICGARFPEGDTLFSAASGGLVCENCRGTAGTGRILSVRAIKVLRFARTASIGQFAGLRLDEGLESELQRALGDAIRIVLDRETNSGKFVEELARPLRASERAARDDVQSSSPFSS
ncbi:MAG: DNA repair protein RecO [bacterium]